MSGYAQQTPSKKTGRNVGLRCNIFGVNCLKCAHKQAKTILHINGAGSYRGGRRGKHDSPRDFRRPVFCSSSVQNHYWAPQSPFGRGENLWFHHDTIFADIKSLLRYEFDSGACDRYEMISYAHLTQPLTITSTHINLIIISSFYFFALPDI